MNQELSLVILAAGMWSRYGWLKQIDEFGPNGESLLEYAVYDALQAGFEHMVFVIRKKFEQAFVTKFQAMLEACPRFSLVFQEFDPEFGFVETDQIAREKPWGTLHATLSTSYVVDGPFAVINADDWYGTQSYALLADRLRTIQPDESLLVWYILGNTLSDHGTVNRGICKVLDHKLQEVTEHYKIGKTEDEILDKEGQVLTGDEIVSMNFRWFHADFFKQAHPLFVQFVLEHTQEAVAEMVIPDAVDQLIQDGTMTCTVLDSPDSRHWVTNPDDKPRVQAAFDQMIQDGVYPRRLWEGE